MDLSTFKELGIAGITVAGIATLFFFVTKALLTEIKTFYVEPPTADESNFLLLF